MKNMERQASENSWRNSFEKAELDPGENVWINVQLGLEREKGLMLKRRVTFYQTLAAASVIMALAVGSFVFLKTNKETQEVASADVNKNQIRSYSPKGKADERVEESINNKSGSNLIASARKIKREAIAVAADDGSQEFSTSASQRNNDPQTHRVAAINDASLIGTFHRSLPLLTNMAPSRLIAAKSVDADPVTAMLAKLDRLERDLRGDENEKESPDHERIWTSVGFAAGTFRNTNTSVNTASMMTTGFRTAMEPIENEAGAAGTTYSVGMNVGAKIATRWLILGGLNYLTQSSDYIANSVVSNADFSSFSPATMSEIDNDAGADRRIIASAPYSVNNNIRFLSFPLQAGYLLIDRDLGVQLNAGVATDMFLQSTASAEGEALRDSRQRIGDESPYRAVNFSGLLGTEISYKLGEHYRIAINPGVRYALSNMYRSAIDVKASPFAFDVGLRFRYIFK